MLLYGGVIVPALDALTIKIKTTTPNLKKKKGALPAEVDQVQRIVWNATKTHLKQLQSAVEQQATAIETAVRQSFAESSVLAKIDSLPFLESSDETTAPILASIREKAVEFSSEKAACVERVSATAQLVSKQVKGILDSRFK